jgi:large-conductance mechanosensitive channel
MRNRAYLFILFIALAFSNTGNAQVVEDLIKKIEQQPVEIVDTLGRNYDTRNLSVRKIDQDVKEEYSGEEFNYERTQTSSQNLFNRIISWLIEGIQNIFGFTLSPFTITILTYVFYFLIGAVVVFMIVKLLGNENASKLFGRTARNTSSVVMEETHIEEIDFTDLIQSNEREGNFRNAVRYQYLAMLKGLSARNLIEWDFQKTNIDYYRELKNLETKEHFKKVSYLYDHVWYGEFPIGEETYREAVAEFQTLKNRAA